MTTRITQFKKSLPAHSPQNGLSSATISWATAEEMHQEYVDNPDALKIDTTSGIVSNR
jgi:hypothetical protein